jgi:hypothetical protein
LAQRFSSIDGQPLQADDADIVISYLSYLMVILEIHDHYHKIEKAHQLNPQFVNLFSRIFLPFLQKTGRG